MLEPEIILYGGTFDPPHYGHSKCLELVLSYYPDARAIVMPAYAPPASSNQMKDTQTSFEHRLAMTKMHFSDQVYANRIEISNLESKLPSPSYSLQTVKSLLTNKTRSLAILLGFDQLIAMDKWFQINELLDLTSVLVVNRGEHDVMVEVCALAKRLNRTYHLNDNQLRWHDKTTGIVWFSESVSPLSSTDIRQSNHSNGLHQKVEEYITKHNLYEYKR